MITKLRGRLKTDELEDQICHMIISSELNDGAPIPSEKMLCEQFGVSRITVRNSMAHLVERKVLRTEKGRGSFVASSDRARALYGKDFLHRIVGISVPCIGDNYFGRIVQSFEAVMRKAGFNTILCIYRMEGWEERDYIEELNLSRIDGLVMAPWESSPLTSTIRKLIAKYHNVALINETLDDKEVSSVSSEDADGASQVVKYLLSLGHTRIAHIHGPSLLLNASDRLKGYTDAMLARGLFAQELVKGHATYTEQDGFDAMEELLSLPETPTAVFCANDYLAIGALKAIARHGLRVPQDISVVGYGNTIASMDCQPQLTSVDQDGDLIGSHAAELLLDLLFKRVVRCRSIKVPAKLVIRGSCAPVRMKTNDLKAGRA